MTELQPDVRGAQDPNGIVHLQRRSGDRALKEVFARSGEMGRRVCEFDWKATPLGPIEAWPPSLKVAASMALTSRFAMFVWWGAELIHIYNDAYAAMTLGAKHPWALGRAAPEVWPEIWKDIGPRVASVLRTGQATWDEELLLILERNGFPEETYHTFSYSPIAGEFAAEGILCAVSEDTQRVLSQRRLKTLRELATHTAEEARSAESACEAAAKGLSVNRFDLPFALIYLLDEDGKRVRLAGVMGLEEGVRAAPRFVDADAPATGATWPFKNVLRTRRPQVVTALEQSFGRLPGGVWPVSAQTAVVQPLMKPGQDRVCGFLVAGISPRRPLDDDYRDFLHLLAGRIAIAIGNARAYEEERKRAEALAEIDRVKTDFFSNISHEFRTPLTLMLGPVDELLAHDQAIPIEARYQIETLQRNSQRLLKLVNALLDFSRIEAGRAQACYEPADLATLTKDLASAFRAAAEKAGVRLIVDCPPLEPAYVDREMWEKIVLNLLSNAFKFTFEGSIEVALRSADGAIVLEVKDTGIGIPEEEVSKVFDRFHRVRGGRARTHAGSGIGLALVQELAKLHGGSVRVTSLLGMGSTFSVAIPQGSAHLPQARVGVARTSDQSTGAATSFVEEALGWLPNHDEAQHASVMPVADRKENPAPARAAAAERILVADDNADMRGYLRRLLEPHWVVETVEDGSKLLGVALVRPPDLILADVMMPGLDGFQLLRELRADSRTSAVPVILLSARAGEEAKVEGMNAGADDYMVKPFSARELLARVAARLEIARVRYDAEQRISSILEGMTDGFIAVDRDWRITYVNAAAERDNAVTRESLLGKTHWEVFPGVLGTEFERTLKHAMAERVPSHGENFYEPHGRWYEMHVHPIKDGGLAFYGRDITERKHAEEALRESEERMRLATEGAQVFAWDVDLTTGTVKYSANVAPVFGYATLPEEYYDLRKSLALVHPDDRERTRETTKRALREIDSLKSEYRVKAAGGRYIWLESHGIVIRGPQGTPQRLLGVAQNISERKDAECALRQLQCERNELLKRLQLQFERMPVACLVIDPNFVAIDWNPAAEKVFGYRRDEIVGKDCHVLVSPHVHSELRNVEQRLVRGDMEAHSINENLTKDGRVILCEWYNTPLLDADGKVMAIFAMAQDVTERVRAEAALRESEERFRTMADSSPIMIWVTDADGRVEFLNRTYLDFFGIERERAGEFDWRGILHPDDRKAYLAAFATAIRERQPLCVRARVCRYDGAWRWIESRGNPRTDAAGRVTGYIGSSPDITDMHASQEALKVADRRKDEFLATVGHELRNPLAAIRYSLSALRISGATGATVERAHELMERKADHLVRLVDDLLEVSRITRGAIELRKGRVDLASVIHDAVETSKSLVESAGHQLDVALPAEPLLMEADPVRLAQVFANLLHNAAKYTNGRGQIWIAARREDTDAVISVRDTGMGISAEMLPRVFDMFMQVHPSLMHGSRGLGIGLTLVQELVGLHGGTVEARSEGLGKGAEFIVRLPLSRAAKRGCRVVLRPALFFLRILELR